MKNSKIFFLAIAIAVGAFPWFLPSIAAAQCTVTNPAFPGIQFPTIQDAINSSFPGGALIQVTGTCNENNIFIGGNRANLTLDGQPNPPIPRATIFSQTPDFNPEATPLQINGSITVNGASNVRIRNFIITSDGTSDGVNIVDGANARLQNNTIANFFREGVFVRSASARIFDNTIRNNGGDGIVVTESSAVRIGFSSPDDGIVRPNTIQGNAGNGISVLRSSTARVVGNKTISADVSGSISGNGGHGISVFKGSHADIASNEISGNGGDGINLRENSAVILGGAPSVGVPAIFTEPNSTTALNGGFGIQCSIGGSANGPIGSLNGSSGERRFEGNCINDLSR